ncbi:hypothetical protein EPR50_G00014380 [Perca flavescens]|uniref:Crumbs homolog 3b n=1 Tax=Perca flavescens TaxID=8167 RepID=A0A484DK97_PERFV|nr:hypothetical protein EPR50_G00014380 [Perca flavescens]
MVAGLAHHHRARRRPLHLDAQKPGRILDSDETHLINPRFRHFHRRDRDFSIPQGGFSPPSQLSVTMAMQVLIPPALSVLSLLSLALLLLLCVIRKKRRMEGTYMPSAEERKQTGSAGSEKPGLPLPLPKEERLI